MSAGTGVRHSEFNASAEEPVHLMQIWILPEREGAPPEYEQKMFPAAERTGQLRLIGSPDGRQGSVTIHQDVDLYSTLLDGQSMTHSMRAGRHAWVQVARGEIELNGMKLSAGDGAAVREEQALALRGTGAEVLLFDLA